jgi:glycosyltransferase involved in cell wall biosynthesis
LAEALAHGLPVIGFAGCAGVTDLIVHGRTGMIAEANDNAESLARALKTLLSDGTMRKEMGKEGPDSIKQFDPPRIFSLWENLLSNIAVPKSGNGLSFA